MHARSRRKAVVVRKPTHAPHPFNSNPLASYRRRAAAYSHRALASCPCSSLSLYVPLPALPVRNDNSRLPVLSLRHDALRLTCHESGLRRTLNDVILQLSAGSRSQAPRTTGSRRLHSVSGAIAFTVYDYGGPSARCPCPGVMEAQPLRARVYCRACACSRRRSTGGAGRAAVYWGAEVCMVRRVRARRRAAPPRRCHTGGTPQTATKEAPSAPEVKGSRGGRRRGVAASTTRGRPQPLPCSGLCACGRGRGVIRRRPKESQPTERNMAAVPTPGARAAPRVCDERKDTRHSWVNRRRKGWGRNATGVGNTLDRGWQICAGRPPRPKIARRGTPKCNQQKLALGQSSRLRQRIFYLRPAAGV
ncbi:MAG: hypothetical protein J3K34DRAFT_427883 [Monoraphidium minutum]|nr:MAG: hypothetical protein J3K34DRAFT_427883 [Monoraphidium minutum]